MEKLGSYWKDFHEILYLKIFRKSAQKIQVFFLICQEQWALYVKIYTHVFPNNISLSSS